MKKSIRILSFLMAFAMLLGSFTVMGSAYQAYKGTAIKDSYNDVDSPVFTTEQYASMALDELDRMLAKEKMVVNVYIGTLDLSSVDGTLDSVKSLLSSVSSLLALLGDASTLPELTGPIDTVRRSNSTDLTVIYGLLDFIANISTIAGKYVNGTLNLGILDSFIADYVFDVRELALGILYSETFEGKAAKYDYFDDGADGLPAKYRSDSAESVKDPNAALNLLQILLNELVLGEWTKLDDLFTDPESYVQFTDYDFGDGVVYDTSKYDYYGWVHRKQWVTIGLGGCAVVKEGAAAPEADYSAIDITTDKNGYDFIENLMRKAYNDLLVPVLNSQTRPWLRKLCGFTYEEKYSKQFLYGEYVNDEGEKVVGDYPNPDYDPNYDGILKNGEDSLTEYAKLFNYDAKVQKVTVTDGKTFVDDFNKILGDFLANILVNNVVDGEVTHSWTWDYNESSPNEKLFQNICTVAKFVVKVSGGLFFSDSFVCPSDEEIDHMSDQAIVALVVREILNNSVDYLYIEDTYTSLPEVGYRAVEQLAWQDIPQYTYTMPVLVDGDTTTYYNELIDKMIDILFDIAIYNLNQGFDMVYESGNDPVNGAGLLQYQGDDGSYETTLSKVVTWAISEYGSILALDFKCDDKGSHNMDDVWSDLDTLINSIIPIKSGDSNRLPWISNQIASAQYVSKSFVFDYIIKPIAFLNATNFAVIFERNDNGAFASMNGVEIIVNLLDGIFDIIAPNVFISATTLDGILDNDALASMVSDFILTLGTKEATGSKGTIQGRGKEIANVALPVVCMILGLSDDQEFKEMQIYMPEVISADESNPTFQIYNGSSGINTGYTDKNGNFTQDNLYTYKIENVTLNTYNESGASTSAVNFAGIAKDNTIAGGDKIDVRLSGNIQEGQLLEFTVNYFVNGEDGTSITGSTALSKTVYAYVGSTDKDDDAIETEVSVNGRKVKYEPAIYLSTNDDLNDIEGYSIRIKDNDGGNSATASVSSVSFSSTAYPFAVKNADASQTSQTMTGEEGLYFLNPFDVAVKSVKDDGTNEYYERFEYYYQKDAKGELILDDNGDPIKVTEAPFDNGGVPNGEYTATTTVNVAGTTTNIVTKIEIYNEYGLTSMFRNAVAANRQLSDYDTTANMGEAKTLYANYVAALKNAARFVLQPKNCATFQSLIAATKSGFENRYEELATELEDCIEALEAYANNAGTAKLEKALGNYSGLNYTVAQGADGPYKVPVEYYEDSYIHFGMRDYVPHTYNKYRTARDRVTSLINSQNFYVPTPFEEGYEPTSDELKAYNEAVEAYQKSVEEKGVIGSIEETYAIHMLNLSGERLIRLEADTSKLSVLFETYGTSYLETLDQSKYTAESYSDYANAVAFTAKVLATPITTSAGEPNLRPSAVNEATTKLIETWKDLEECASYEKINASVSNAEGIIMTYGNDASAQSFYTAESYQAFLDAYQAAKKLAATPDLGAGDQDKLDGTATTLDLAIASLEEAKSTVLEPIVEFSTEDSGTFMDSNYEYSFIPFVNTEIIEDEGGYELLDGTKIDGFILGFGAEIYSEDEIMDMFSTFQNATLYTVPSASGCYTTGSIVQILRADGSVYKTYQIVYRGDVNSDGSINKSDTTVMNLIQNFVDGYDYLYDSSLGMFAQGVAADVNDDYAVDGSDISIVMRAGFGYDVIDQVNGDVL